MNKTILFSPVGGTDPISNYNCKDGSLLHICRVYKPDKVYLYMSKEILDIHNKDDRYLYCLNKLSEWQDWQFEYEIIARPELIDVQEFDPFYRDFKLLIEDILRTCDESDTLILNVSSGTPAMKSALLIIMTLGELPCKAIQVATPEKGMNEHRHKDYDVKTLWDVYKEESAENFASRCKEVICPSLSMIKQEEIVKKLVNEYSYQAALEVAETLPTDITENYIELIKMAAARVLLNMSATDKILLNCNAYNLPVRDSNLRKYFEYALALDIKIRKHEYADFIRAISPLLTDLFERILEKQTDIKLDNYCYIDKKNVRKWDFAKLSGTKVYDALTEDGRDFNKKDIYSSQLTILITKFANTPDVVELVGKLRLVEAELRNIAAHQIVSVTEETVKSKFGFSANHIMEMIKMAFTYAGFNIKKEYWNSYDDMNKVIIKAISGDK